LPFVSDTLVVVVDAVSVCEFIKGVSLRPSRIGLRNCYKALVSFIKC